MIAPTSMVITPSTNYLHGRLVLAIIHCAYSHVQSQRRGRAHGWYAKEVLHMSTHIVHPFDRTIETPPRPGITFKPPKIKSTRLQAAEKFTVDLTVASQGQTHGRSIKSPPRLRGFAYLRLSLRHSQRKNLPRRVTGRRAHCGVLPVVEITSNR